MSEKIDLSDQVANKREVWNIKAKNFPRFVKGTKDTLEILEFFENSGVDFKGKKILDIGCGNGRFALELAFLADKIIALDTSDVMLENLQEDAQKLGLKNIERVLCEWENFDFSEFEIDLGFASMTPALNNKAGFEKALGAGKQGLCYIGWGRERSAKLVDEVLKMHNLELLLPKGLPNALEWANELARKEPPHRYFESSYIYSSDEQKAIEDMQFNVKIHGGEPDVQKITEFVRGHLKNGVLEYEVRREIGVAFFEN